jgi:hypothetical protein
MMQVIKFDTILQKLKANNSIKPLKIFGLSGTFSGFSICLTNGHKFAAKLNLIISSNEILHNYKIE